jgi:hypothetical protein
MKNIKKALSILDGNMFKLGVDPKEREVVKNSCFICPPSVRPTDTILVSATCRIRLLTNSTLFLHRFEPAFVCSIRAVH